MSRVLQAVDSIHQVGIYCLALVPPNYLPKVHFFTSNMFPFDSEAPCNDDDLSGLGWFDISQARFALYDCSSLLSLHCMLAAVQCIVISPICGWL